MDEEFLAIVIHEEAAQPPLLCMNQPTSLQHFKKLTGCLSSINMKRSIDCTNGASRYIAYSLGICLCDVENDLIDVPHSHTTEDCSNKLN